MTGKRYYLTTLGDWQRHAARFANSHFIMLEAIDAPESSSMQAVPDAPDVFPPDGASSVLRAPTDPLDLNAPSGATQILALVEADEGAHLALEDDAAFEPLPHALAQKPISDRAQAALAPFGVERGATTFDAAEILARVHPLLRHRVF